MNDKEIIEDLLKEHERMAIELQEARSTAVTALCCYITNMNMTLGIPVHIVIASLANKDETILCIPDNPEAMPDLTDDQLTLTDELYALIGQYAQEDENAMHIVEQVSKYPINNGRTVH